MGLEELEHTNGTHGLYEKRHKKSRGCNYVLGSLTPPNEQRREVSTPCSSSPHVLTPVTPLSTLDVSESHSPPPGPHNRQDFDIFGDIFGIEVFFSTALFYYHYYS